MMTFIENGSVTSVPGFKAAGIHCGIKKKKKDLALIFSETPCSAAGVFTINKVKAAPLIISQKLVHEQKQVRAVLVNSGNANACTGEQGFDDAYLTQQWAAEQLQILPEEILVSSTGVIGQRMPMDVFKPGIEIVRHGLSDQGGLDAAEAIMTTDSVRKSWAVRVQCPSGEFTIGLIAKGSGMIMPNMATMLGFITTDAKVETPLLQSILQSITKKTFNRISVDGDTSTNDMVVILANGLSHVVIKPESEEIKLFETALEMLCQNAAKAIVTDGEGATKLITVNITNAKNQKQADAVGKTIATSSLVKTAIHGADANWGRIICAAGYSGVNIEPEKISISFDDLPVLNRGYDLVLDEVKALELLKQEKVTINVSLGMGRHSSTWWTCDLSPDYVKINASYRT